MNKFLLGFVTGGFFYAFLCEVAELGTEKAGLTMFICFVCTLAGWLAVNSSKKH